VHLILARSVTGEPRRRLEHKISLHNKARSKRGALLNIFNNGSTTGPNGVIKLGLAPYMVTVLTTKHSPAEVARTKEVRGGGGMFPRELLECRLQSLSRTTNFAVRFFFERKCCLLAPCQQMKPGLKGKFPLLSCAAPCLVLPYMRSLGRAGALLGRCWKCPPVVPTPPPRGV
jgi:hypothetical protein